MIEFFLVKIASGQPALIFTYLMTSLTGEEKINNDLTIRASFFAYFQNNASNDCIWGI